MAKLMQRGAIPVDRLIKGRDRRHRDIVGSRMVIGTVSTDPHIRATGVDKGRDLGQNLDLRPNLWRLRQRLGQAFALIDVEHGEALEESDRARLPPIVTAPVVLGLRREAISVADGGPALALADIATRRLRLGVRQPAL